MPQGAYFENKCFSFHSVDFIFAKILPVIVTIFLEWLRYTLFLRRLSFMKYMGLSDFSLSISLPMIMGISVFYLLWSSKRKYESLTIVSGQDMK